MIDPQIISLIKNKDKPVVINGAGVVGKVLLDICRDHGIEVDAFCDGSIKVSQENDFMGYDVIHTPCLRDRYDDAFILISAASIKDVVDLLKEMGFNDWFPGGALLKDHDISQNNFDSSLDYTKFAIENCILCHDGYMNDGQLFMRSIDLIITEKCSLRCSHCSNLMQYYEKPQNCDLDMLFESIDAYCDVIDEVMDFRVIGGETFMNKDWPKITEKLIREPKARRVVLYTNSTIVPKKETIPLLQNDKVIIIATDYGKELSRKLPELKAFCEENGIAYHILEVEEWLDCATITRHERSIEDNVQLYRLCCAKNMATLSDGKVFRCPYAANAHRLQAVPDFHEDYVDLMDHGKGPEEKKRMLIEFLYNIPYLKTCDFCNGRPLSGVEVAPAVQVKEPLAYERYGDRQKC